MTSHTQVYPKTCSSACSRETRRRGAADDDAELRFVLDARALRREHDDAAVADERRRRLQEEERLGGDLVAELLRVRGVVAPDAQDLERLDRRAQIRLAERDHAPGGRSAGPWRRREERGLVSVDAREVDLVLVLETCESHRRRT